MWWGWLKIKWELIGCQQQCNTVFLWAHTFYVPLFQAFKFTIIAKPSMQAPVTSPIEMIFVPMWPSGWQTRWISLQVYLVSVMGRGPGTLCTHVFNPKRLCTWISCWMFLAALTSIQPVSSRKHTTRNYAIQPQHRFLLVGDSEDSVSVATLLPGDTSGGPGWCLRNDRDGYW